MTTRKIRNQKTKDYRTTKEERIQEKERQTVQLCTKKQQTCTGGSGKRLWGNTSDSVHRRRWYQDTIPVCRKTRGEQRRSQKTGNDDDDDDDDMAIGIRRPTFAIAEKLDTTSQVQTGP
jgi:hypothetical protein